MTEFEKETAFIARTMMLALDSGFNLGQSLELCARTQVMLIAKEFLPDPTIMPSRQRQKMAEEMADEIMEAVLTVLEQVSEVAMRLKDKTQTN